MKIKRSVWLFDFTIAAFFLALLALTACKPGLVSGQPLTPAPTLSLEQTSSTEFVTDDFDAVHAPIKDSGNEYLIFGNLAVSKPAVDLSPELAVFLGRWEGYNFGPPIKKDRKAVLVVQEINTQGGTAYGWSGTNLQYPDLVDEFHFRVVQGDTPSIEWQKLWPGGVRETVTFTYDRQKDQLTGWLKFSVNATPDGPYVLTRERSFYVYKDYAQYLESKHIYARTYQDGTLQGYGKGYLVYLPEGYEANPKKAWPLIFFLHGAGDRGDNVFLTAKASPFMFIREQEPLPFIIVAPLLSAGYTSFPEAYLDGVLAEARANYRIDPKRMYLTGLSMGGEGTYRFALHQPRTFAAIAPLCAFLENANAAAMKSLRAVPVWAIHGDEDTIIPLAWGQQPVNALTEAGGEVQFTILEGHDHDVWTDTYSDPAFYDWLLQHQKP